MEFLKRAGVRGKVEGFLVVFPLEEISHEAV